MRKIVTIIALFTSAVPLIAQAQPGRIYWGDEVPPGWSGTWPEELRTIPERTNFRRTMSTFQLHEFIAELKWRSENMHVLEMFTSPRGKVAPAVVLANPRVTSPAEARASGKPVIYLLGNIHPPESEAAEALAMVMRDILVGDRRSLLDNQIIIIAPIYNVDGTDTFRSQDGSLGSATPVIFGKRENSDGHDLNRDAVKLETIEGNGLNRLLNAWDPLLFLDGHLMSRVNHGYANTYGTSTVPAAHPGPRDYVTHTLFPAVRDRVREEFGLEVFTHALFGGRGWPPTSWSHDRAAWTVDAKFVVNDYGLRNRMAIITETPGQPTFERRIYAQYAYILALLEYTNTHGREMQEVVRAADEETVARVLAQSESSELMNFLDGEYVSGGKIDVLGYRDVPAGYLPGTSVRATPPGAASGRPEVVRGIDDLTVSRGTRSASVPRAYILPPALADIAAKLRAHDIEVRTLDAPMRAEGEEFLVEAVRKERRTGYDMTVLDGAFSARVVREFPAGSFFVDMAQPMANAAFYYLEPQARDGFVGWGVMDGILERLSAAGGSAVYPVFKYRRDAM
jgi:hypothetical protein